MEKRLTAQPQWNRALLWAAVSAPICAVVKAGIWAVVKPARDAVGYLDWAQWAVAS